MCVRESCAHAIAPVLLPEIQVRNRVRLLQRAEPLQVLHDADDFNAVRPDDDHAANRPAVRPDVAGERLVHDGDARTVHRVAVIEFATLDDADAQRLEVPRTDERRAHLIRLRRIGRVAGKPHRRDRAGPAGQRRNARRTCRKHARQRFEALDDVALIGPGAIVREAHEARPEPDDGHAIRVEARAAVEHEEAAHEQAARAEQQHRQCDLHDDQPFAHDRRAAGRRRTFPLSWPGP